MPETTYQYDLVGDFPNEICDPADLAVEIRASSIVTELVGVNFTSDDPVNVVFVDALSGGDKTTLDGIVAAHEGVPYEFTGRYVEEEYTKRKLTKVTFYARKDGPGVYSLPVEERSYTYQGRKLLTERVQTFDEQGNTLTDHTYNFTTASGGKVRKERA